MDLFELINTPLVLNTNNIIIKKNPSGMGFEPMKPRHSIRDFQSLAIPLSDPDVFYLKKLLFKIIKTILLLN